MTASVANGFGQVLFQPDAKHCAVAPYAFHPMYATSTPDTRVTWTAHTYNVAYSDEIGHFELCNQASPGGKCVGGSADDQQQDGDDFFCLNASASLLVPLGGCEATEFDFDGESYQDRWPGSLGNPATDQLYNPSPILFTSPLFNGNQNYTVAAFQANMPRIEDLTVPPCDRHGDGSGCVNPPVGAQFYPIYSLGHYGGACYWQEGGPSIPGTYNRFGGNSVTEYGTTLKQEFYPAPGNTIQLIYENFTHVLSNNPCPAPAG
jgi:hypothetical protein